MKSGRLRKWSASAENEALLERRFAAVRVALLGIDRQTLDSDGARAAFDLVAEVLERPGAEDGVPPSWNDALLCEQTVVRLMPASDLAVELDERLAQLRGVSEARHGVHAATWAELR